MKNVVGSHQDKNHSFEHAESQKVNKNSVSFKLTALSLAQSFRLFQRNVSESYAEEKLR